MLEITDLHVKIAKEDREILKGLTLTIPKGEVHAIMGPNGSGKSTLAYVLAGRDDYEVTSGDILWNGESVLGMEPEVRAAKGVFLAFQYPIEIPGVASLTFLRTARQRRAQGTRRARADDARLHEARQGQGGEAHIDMEMLKRPVNVGFSGGEKKRSEILQMEILQPTLCVLDETDCGLDIDALRIVADGVNGMRAKDRAMLVITHYQRLFNYIVPDKVHVMATAGSSERAGLTLPKSSRRRATQNIRGKPREHGWEAKLERGKSWSRRSDRWARLHARTERRGGARCTRSLKTKAEQGFSEAYAAIADTLPGGDDVRDVRERAIGRFEALGLPHRRIEAWKYTDLRNVLKEALPPQIVDDNAGHVADVAAALGPLARDRGGPCGVRQWRIPGRAFDPRQPQGHPGKSSRGRAQRQERRGRGRPSAPKRAR